MATKVGLLHLEVTIGDAMSLKDKRRIVKSFKDRIAHRRNVSIAEVDHLDSMRSAVLAVSMVGNDARYIESALRKIVDSARLHRGWTLLEYDVELI